MGVIAAHSTQEQGPAHQYNGSTAISNEQQYQHMMIAILTEIYSLK
jgi:hypothetical protein